MNVVSYVRVSDKEQIQGFSLSAQTEAIQRECDHRGYTVVAEYRDEGLSARSDKIEKRPGFQAAVEMVQSGQADAIIVHKLDRAARNIYVFLQVVAGHGISIISVVENIDYSTPLGKMMAHTQAMIAQYFSDNLSTEIKKGMDERKRQGLYNGSLPFGARKPDGDDKGRLPPVPDDEPVLCTVADRKHWSPYDALQLMFELEASGSTIGAIVEEIRGIGFDLTGTGIAHMLRNRFYLGELPLGRHPSRGGSDAWGPGEHEALITEDLFNAAQRTLIENQDRRKSSTRRNPVYAFSGLVRCGQCRGPMQCRMEKGGTLRLSCRNRYERRNCDEPSCKAEAIGIQLFYALEQLTPSDDVIERIVEMLSSGVPEVESQRAEIAEKRNRLRDVYILGDMTLAEYQEGTGALERELLALPEPERPPDVLTVISFLRDLPAAYRAATQEQRRELLSRVFVDLMVKDKQLAAIQPRAALGRIMSANVAEVGAELQPESRISGVRHGPFGRARAVQHIPS